MFSFGKSKENKKSGKSADFDSLSSASIDPAPAVSASADSASAVSASADSTSIVFGPADSVSADSVSAGSISADSVSAGSVSAGSVSAGSISADSVSDDGESSADSEMTAFEAVNLSFAYPGSSPVLKNINLKIIKGEFTIIVGLNGSGKSTFAYHLNGLLKPTSGKMFVFGKDTRQHKNSSKIHREVGIVFQNPYTQFVGNTVEEDIAFGPENLGLPRKEIQKRVDTVLDSLLLRELAYQDPSSLSGGEAQAAAIAGVLAMDPECIVFDEVTSMLDYASEERISKIVDSLQKRGKTIVYITHESKNLLKADRIVVFNNGEISFDGNVEDYISSGKFRLPDVIELMNYLHEKGYDVSKTISDPKEAAEEIIKTFQKE
jgi:ABC-type cobalt transport system, ATPase component